MNRTIIYIEGKRTNVDFILTYFVIYFKKPHKKQGNQTKSEKNTYLK